MQDRSEDILIERAASGDRDAFARLVDRHYATIYRVAYKWCGDASDAEDIAQDVCIKLAGAIGGYRGTAAFSSWLYRITLNMVRDAQRARQRRMRKAEAFALVAERSVVPDPENELTQSQIWARVQDLPEKQRDAVLLVFSEELNHREAAEIMGCKESTVSWHIHEAKKRLSGMVRDEADG